MTSPGALLRQANKDWRRKCSTPFGCNLDLTPFTTVDPNSRFTKIDPRITWAGMIRNETAYNYKDFGANHFRDFEHLLTVIATSADDYNTTAFWAISDIIGNYQDIRDNGGLTCHFYIDASSVWRIFIGEYPSDPENEDSYIGVVNTLYYLTIARVGTTFTCKIYSDAARTTLLDTLTLTVPTTKWRYLYCVQSRGSSWQPNADSDGYCEHLNIQEKVKPIIKSPLISNAKVPEAVIR